MAKKNELELQADALLAAADAAVRDEPDHAHDGVQHQGEDGQPVGKDGTGGVENDGGGLLLAVAQHVVQVADDALLGGLDLLLRGHGALQHDVGDAADEQDQAVEADRLRRKKVDPSRITTGGAKAKPPRPLLAM